jgi:hypothetical protein
VTGDGLPPTATPSVARTRAESEWQAMLRGEALAPKPARRAPVVVRGGVLRSRRRAAA